MFVFKGFFFILSSLVYFFLLVGFCDVIMNNGSVILLNECDWNIYDNIYVLYEIEVKLKIKCVVICF